MECIGLFPGFTDDAQRTVTTFVEITDLPSDAPGFITAVVETYNFRIFTRPFDGFKIFIPGYPLCKLRDLQCGSITFYQFYRVRIGKHLLNFL